MVGGALAIHVRTHAGPSLRGRPRRIQRSRDLADYVASVAGEVASAEEAMAIWLDQRAVQDPAQTPQLRVRAQQARDHAARERREQARWQRLRVADECGREIDGADTTGPPSALGRLPPGYG